MSEEILKALMRLFAIISKQDDGLTDAKMQYVKVFLQQQISDNQVDEYYSQFLTFTEEKKKKRRVEKAASQKEKDGTSMTDSVRILGICKRINKTLDQKQKIIVLVRLFELLNSDRNFSENRMAIIDTVAKVFKIKGAEYKLIENFSVDVEKNITGNEDILSIGDFSKEDINEETRKIIQISGFSGVIYILRLVKENLYFLRYNGKADIELNSNSINNKKIYLFANGSTIKPSFGKPVYYSDVSSRFLESEILVHLSFEAQNIQYTFPNGNIGLQDVTISETEGTLIALMGASGAGKTTLLNVLSGLETPSKGAVKINGIDLHQESDQIEGVIGFVPQDDLLIEELTVYQNLYYSAKLCFKNLSESELDELIVRIIGDLGLSATKDLRVGNVMDKTISGGQRKRLNIGLELMREPSIMFLDEPTSGLSSRDSENVLDLLRELTLKGKLIFVVIHQPSSDIYKMFDKVILLDTGGYQIYYGNPIEAVTYFKTLDHQINSKQGECPNCGNVNPEVLFNIIEARVVDDYGNITDFRKVSPIKWNNFYLENFEKPHFVEIKEAPPKGLSIPNKFKQWTVFLTRDTLSKVSNKQYMLLNMLEAPLLAFFLSIIVRYVDDNSHGIYHFRYNDNIPAFIFMCIIVALFIGLMVSAEEIFKDRKILKREKFLNLSRTSYLLAKITVLFTLSIVQTFLFVLIGNSILGIQDMGIAYWFTLFSVSCFANLLGLNISATFNSAVTIYILIPLLIIPQMILGGAMFSFDKLNKWIGGGHNVPVIAEVMVARWAYEGLIVHQFKNNEYEKLFFEREQKESQYDFKAVHLYPELKKRIEQNLGLINSKSDSLQMIFKSNIDLINNEMMKEFGQEWLASKNYAKVSEFDALNAKYLLNIIESLRAKYNLQYIDVNNKKDLFISSIQQNKNAALQLKQLKKATHNESLTSLVKLDLAKNDYIVSNNEIIAIKEPIYQNPIHTYLGVNEHFYAPYKYFFGKKISTLVFNNIFIWFMTFLLYLTLYFEIFKKLTNISTNFKK